MRLTGHQASRGHPSACPAPSLCGRNCRNLAQERAGIFHVSNHDVALGVAAAAAATDTERGHPKPGGAAPGAVAGAGTSDAEDSP
eukprot:5678476-Alexandrium_andersonii.AAC.1